METRRVIVAFIVAMTVFFVWTNLLAPKLFPHAPTTQMAESSPESQPADSTSSQTQPSGVAIAPVASSQPGGSQPAASTPAGVHLVESAGRERVHLGDASASSPYPMGLEIDPRGGGIAEIQIRGHYETVKKEKPYTIIEPAVTGESEELYSFSTAAIYFENLKLDVPLNKANWTLHTEPDGETVSATIEVQDAQKQPLARLIKQYHLVRSQPTDHFDLGLSVRIENLTAGPIAIRLTQQGPLGFKREDLRSEDRTIVGAMWNGEAIAAKGHLRSEVAKLSKLELGSDQSEQRVAWAAELNRYFTCIVAPHGRMNPQDPPRFAGMEAIDAAESSDPRGDAARSALTFQYVTNTRNIAAGGSETVAFDCYIGPKSKKAFISIPEYARLDYYAVIKQGFYACAPAALVSVMMKLLEMFHAIWPHNYGLAIICLVLIVRAILHPITKKSQVNMMKMQKQMSVLQPKLETAKKKYANDRVAMQQEQMRIYQEAGVNPAGSLLSCLPMMLQIPIWGALWTALGATVAMRHAPFDGYWIKDLSAPDALIQFGAPIYVPLISRLLGGPFTSFNLLPVLLGISQALQARFMPRGAPPAQTGGAPDQLEQQRKMMMFMSILFVLMLYNAPSGLNLYIMASNLFGILEQWIIREHIKEEEKRMNAGGPPTGSGGGDVAPRSAGAVVAASPRKETWFQKKWKGLEKQVEDARRQQSQRDKGNRKR